MKSMIKLNLNRIILVFFISLLIRLILFGLIAPWEKSVINNIIIPVGNDPLTYHQLAKNLLDYQIFAYEKDLPPTILRTPGYPLLVAGIYSIFGTQPINVLIFQILIDSFSAVLIFFIFAQSFNKNIGFYAGVLYAIDPHLSIFSLTMYSDTYFVFFLILTFYFFNNFFSHYKNRTTHLGLAAISLGMVNIIKPTAILLPILLVVFIILYFRKNIKQGLRFSSLFIIIFLIVISPWLIRNYIVFDKIIYSISGDYNLLVLNVAPMEIEKRNEKQNIVIESLLDEADSLMTVSGDSAQFKNVPTNYWEELTLQYDFNKAKYWRKLAIRYISDNPTSFLKHYASGIIHSFFNLGTGTYAELLQIKNNNKTFNIKSDENFIQLIKLFFKQKSTSEIIIGIFIILYLAVVYTSLAIGFFKTYKLSDKFNFYLFTTMCIYFILIAGAGGLARFKMPAIPFYIGFAAYGLDFLINKHSKKNKFL